jgi:hypothetical protein
MVDGLFIAQIPMSDLEFSTVRAGITGTAPASGKHSFRHKWLETVRSRALSVF